MTTNGQEVNEQKAVGDTASRVAERAQLQRKRSIAIAVCLALLVLLFYIATIVKIGGIAEKAGA